MSSADHDDGQLRRARDRYQRAMTSAAVSVAARVATAVVLIVGVRLVSAATTTAGLGLWLLLVTSLTLVGFADLGIGNGLLNVVAEATGREDDSSARQAIASAFFALLGLAAVLGALFAVASPHVDWATLLNVPPELATDANRSMAVFVASLLVSMPLGVASRVLIALQQGWVANAWMGAGSLLSLIALVVSAAADAPLPVLVAAMVFGLPAAQLANSLVFFGHSRPDLRPRLRTASRRAARRVLRQGALFFVLATAIGVGYQSDSLVISHFEGAKAAATYGVPFRLFMLAPTAVTLLVLPLWPAYAEAAARGDLHWVRITLRRSLFVSLLLTGIPSIALLFTAQPIIDRWVSGSVRPSLGVLLGIASWAVLSGFSTALAAFLNGVGVLRFQAAAAAAMATTNLALSIILVQRVGIAGPVYATVITQTLVVLVPTGLIMRPLLARGRGPDALREWMDRWATSRTALRDAASLADIPRVSLQSSRPR